MIMETERLRLRELTPEDLDALYAVLGDSDIMRHYPYTFDTARVENWTRRNQQRYGVFGFGLWAVCRKDTGELIGDCGITMQQIDRVILPEIGYHIRRDCQRQGYARETARACRDWIFEHTPFLEVYSYMKQDNLPSAAVARANGMEYRGAFTDGEGETSVCYAIRRADWQRLRKA